MRQFTDSQNGKWTISLTIGTVMRVKGSTSFNLFEPKDHCQPLSMDEAVFFELLWHLVEPQAVERQINAEQFGQLIAADCLHEARRVFFEEWIDFFHHLHRPDKAAAVEKTAAYLAEAVALAEEKLKSPEMKALDGKLRSRMQETLNAEFGKLQGLLDAIPDRTPSANSGR